MWSHEKSSDALKELCPLPFELPPEYAQYHPSIGMLIMYFAAISGYHYNLTNLVVGFYNAENKMYALGCMFPYAQFFLTMYLSSYSRFFLTNPYAFLCMNGLYLTYVTGNFNLNSTAEMKFDYIFAEPIIFFIALYIDYIVPNSEEGNQVVLLFYIIFVAQTFIKYILFMRSVVNQVCDHLDIPFITVFEPKNKVKA